MLARRFLAIWLVLLSCVLPARAAPPIAMHHVSWTAREGAPQMVLTMTQTRDGWLWLGSSTGLYRFDGVRFERYAPSGQALPSLGIGILNTFDDGSLWIGYRYGGASVLAEGRLRHYNERDGLPVGATVWGLERDGGGRMWAATARGMYRLDGQRWRAAGADFALPVAPYKTLMRDRDGALWAQGAEGVYRLPAGAQRFVKATPDSGTGVLFQVPDGSVWSWNAPAASLRALTPPDGGAAPRRWSVEGEEVNSLLFDRQGDLWVGRINGVEYHAAHGIQRSGMPQGLSGRWVAAIFEDREGSIWTSTSTGIDRFRRQRIEAVAMPVSTVTNPLAADADGGVWVGRYHFPRPHNGRLAPRQLDLGPAVAPDRDLATAYRDAAGVLWLGDEDRVWRSSANEVRAVPLPVKGSMVGSMAGDVDGSLWAMLAPQGLYRLDAQYRWHPMQAATGLPGQTPRVVASSPQLGLWLAYPRNKVLQLHQGVWRSYGPEDGVALGTLEAMHVTAAHVWIGGEKGLALWQGTRFVPVGGVGAVALEGVSGIAELDDGDVWVDAAAGLFRIPAAEIARLKATPGYRVHYEKLDNLDGLTGNAPMRYPVPTMVKTTDNKLWLSTTSGVFRIDPALRPTLGPAAPVLIRALGPPGHPRPALDGLRLAANTSALQIDYTALALAMPERVAFRYRLDGVDGQWQEVGQRREAYYNNLEPGDYRFSVEVTDYAGVWSGRPATLAFSIAPTIPQSWWFKTLCALLLLVACWMLYRRRMHVLALQVAARLEERTRERERIARELHDTLLQSVQGMILHVHAATLSLPEPAPERVAIEAALQQADDVLLEGRERVRDLRAGEAGKQDLAEAIGAMPGRLGLADVLHVKVEGKLRKLHPLVYDEVLAIAGEAVANACRHAGASRIEVQLSYGAGELRLCVRDDGAGIPAHVMAAGGRSNHWGICGMYERAEGIKAKLTLRSAPGAGTEWLLLLPGALAYQAKAYRSWFGRAG
ncbi:sensor histidine kinase [Duganella sp. PWIR1]